MYPDEQKASGLHQATVLADDYSLKHKQSFLKGEQKCPVSLLLRKMFRNICCQWFPEAETMDRTEAYLITHTRL